MAAGLRCWASHMKKVIFAGLLAVCSCSSKSENLLSGDTLSAWTKADGSAPGEGWEFEGGILHRVDKSGDILTKSEYSDFELVWEWKIAPGANSGVKYWVTTINGRVLGLEYQVIDDQGHADALKNPDHTVACIYDMVEASADKKVNPPGEWNSSKIVASDGKIEHWLNGMKVADLDTRSEDYQKRFEASKYAKHEGFAPGKGKILIQDHGDEVWYRNMRITRL
jgi:hypothetical protein